MSDCTFLSRRGFVGGTLAASGLMMAGSAAAAQSGYPSRRIQVVIPTGQGGGAERLARAFDDPWSKLLGQPFEYSFHPGAGGQIGYELFVNRREKDGHNLLFGNMGPETIMYALQKPNYNYPKDYTYFCRMDVDDSCLFVSRQSPLQDVSGIVDAAKKKPLNVAVSRIPHPASIGTLALGEATSSQFNLVPYGGGNPTLIAVMNGEADIGALPITGVLSLSDKLKVVGVFSRKENIFANLTKNAPTINSVFGTNIPDLSSSRAWAVHTEWADKNPQHFDRLQKTAEETHKSAAFREAFAKTGAPVEALVYGDRSVCTEYAHGMLELAQRYEKILSAQK